MPQSALEIAKELTMAVVEAGNMSAEDMHDTLQKTHATLLTLKAQEELGATTSVPMSESPRARVDWRKSITKHAISCLECGQTFKQISRRHLMTHGLVGQSYRVKHGIPRTQSLAARETTARRQQIAQERRPWEKTPRFIQAQARDGKATSEPEPQASRAAAEAPIAEAPTPSKRARKTAPKKTTQKKSSQA
jgi:predicted transcriptional regulator